MNEEYDAIDADLVPIVLIAAEIGETVGWVANHFGEAVRVDDIGLRAVPATAAQRFFTERAEWKARHEEETRRRREQRKVSLVVGGVPAQEGMTPFESMAAADDFTTPRDEFGRPAPTFLDDELMEGQRRLAEKQARAKEQAAEKMRKDLGR